MSAARPLRSAKAWCSLRGPAVSSVSVLMGEDLGQVLVTSSAQRHERRAALRGRALRYPGDRVGRLEGRDDPLEPRKLSEGRESILVRDRLVADPSDVAQVGVLGPDAGIVEPSR